MKLTIVFTGKTKIAYIEEGVKDYFNRLKHYVKTDIQVIPDIRNTRSMSWQEIRKKEGEAMMPLLPSGALIVLLDENGKEYSSVELAQFFEKSMHSGRDICLVTGGAYGFSDEVHSRSDLKISLSRMTFSHQMVRMILLEQIYRAFTISRGEKYHHGNE